MPHSSGPWHWLYFKHNDRLMAKPFALANDEHDVLLSTDNPHGGVWIASNLEDRALIAAAPDLLDACEAIQNRLTYLRNLWGDEGVTRSLCDQVNAAILKAKGGA